MNEQELVGITLGNCTLERELGRGGMATVFLAQQSRPTRTVAVKVLRDTPTDDNQQQRVFLERFRREADTAARLEHKNILPIYEYDEATINGTPLAYLVMPYIRGGTLRQRMDDLRHEGKLFDLQTVADYVSQMADALGYAHSMGIVHRDVKPGNLLFHSDGRLVLADFGIARLTAMPSLTMAGTFIGTAEYASPEQASAAELDSRSDIYSLGVILYELLTGNVPFTGSTPFEVMLQHLHEPVPAVRIVRPDLSPAIEFVVRKALAKKPDERYQQVSELAADFQAAVTPALVKPAGFRLNGDAGNSDMTVADSSWQPQPARARGATAPMRPVDALAPQATPRVALPPARTPLPTTKPVNSPLPLPAGGSAWSPKPVQIQLPSELEESDAVKTYRPARRLFFYIISLVILLAQFVVLTLILRNTGDGQYGNPSAITLGVLLGNALNLLALTAIGFTGIVRQRNISASINRVLWTSLAALILSSFFISYGEFSQQSLDLPLVSYIILLLTNIFSIRELSKADAANEQVEVAPVYWNSALIGALTGLIPLTLLLIFALLAPLFWTANSSLFLRLLGVLLVALIGAPTPGSMMAVWLSHRMSFPILVRTSALAGLFMFIAAYLLVVLASWLIPGKPLFSDIDGQFLVVGTVIMGIMLGLIGLLRGMLDAWIYHRVVMRRP